LSFTDKIDVLDLIIEILKEHERKLDEFTHRLEKVLLKVEETWGE